MKKVETRVAFPDSIHKTESRVLKHIDFLEQLPTRRVNDFPGNPACGTCQ